MGISEDYQKARYDLARKIYDESRAGRYVSFSKLAPQDQERWLKKADKEMNDYLKEQLTRRS